MNKFGDLRKILGDSKNVPAPLLSATTGILDQVTDLIRVREIEKTKRRDIDARKEVAISVINSQKEIILECMEGVFLERAAVLKNNFKIIDYAMENNNIEMLNMALANVVQVIQTSPFQSIEKIIENKGTLRLE